MIGLPADIPSPPPPFFHSHTPTHTNIPCYIHPTRFSFNQLNAGTPFFPPFLTTSLQQCIFFLRALFALLFQAPCWCFLLLRHHISRDEATRTWRRCRITFLMSPQGLKFSIELIGWEISEENNWQLHLSSIPATTYTYSRIIPFFRINLPVREHSQHNRKDMKCCWHRRNGHMSRKVKIELCCHLNNIESSGR